MIAGLSQPQRSNHDITLLFMIMQRCHVKILARQVDAPATPSRAVHSRQQAASAKQSSQEVVYARGPMADVPEAHASRRERFAELDELQPGWQVELCSRGAGGAIDAIFYSPSGERMSFLRLCQRVPDHFLLEFPERKIL